MGKIVLACLLVLASLPACAQSPQQPKHPVFAHYMVCFATYGDSIEGYQREIREAQAAGIDGFALNEGAWQNEPMYVKRTALLFQAAQALGTNFQFIFSLDLATLHTEYIPDIIRTYANHPNYYHYQGRPLVSTFGGEIGVDWQAILAQLKAEKIDICFVPFFYPRPNITELPDLPAVNEHFAKWRDTVDGLFFFGAAGTDTRLTACNASYAQVAKATHKLCMASVTPFYWGAMQSDRRFFETRGGQGIAGQWMSIIANQPDFVEIVTWNDFNESYICPVEQPEKYTGGLLYPRHYCHAGYLELSKYYIQWYKTGRQPQITRDGLFYVYRIHLKAAKASPARLTNVPAGVNLARLVSPVADLSTEVHDNLYLTTMLTAPAELRVASGGTQTNYPMAAGIAHVAVPFQPGAQHFELYRNGILLITLDGEPVQADPDHINFFPTTGFGYAK